MGNPRPAVRRSPPRSRHALWHDVPMATGKRYSLGVDIGGTFTDVAIYDRVERREYSRKVLTTHGDPARAVADGVQAVLQDFALDPGAFQRAVHATTHRSRPPIRRHVRALEPRPR